MDDHGNPEPDLSNTLRFMRCDRCGNIFVTNISGYGECPECLSVDATPFRPDEASDRP